LGQPSCSESHIRGSKGIGLNLICKYGELAVIRVARTSRNKVGNFGVVLSTRLD